jgi:hypothetical protein
MKTLQCVQHPLPEQRETGSAVALSFDEFELIHEAFSLSVGMDERSSSKHLLFLPLESSGEALDITEGAAGNLLHPLLESVPFPLTNEVAKGLGEAM